MFLIRCKKCNQLIAVWEKKPKEEMLCIDCSSEKREDNENNTKITKSC